MTRPGTPLGSVWSRREPDGEWRVFRPSLGNYVLFYEEEPVELLCVADPEGEYLGWLATGAEKVSLVRPRALFGMQFPYGVEAEERAGKGRAVRLSLVAAADR